MKKKTFQSKQTSIPSRGSQGRRYTAEQKGHVLDLVRSGMAYSQAAETIGASVESVRLWRKQARGMQPTPPAVSKNIADVPELSKKEAARSPYKVTDPGQGLGDHEVAAVLELKKRHPSMGPAQLKAQLKRFKGWRLSNKAIARVLRQHGYELVHTGPRPQGPEPISFEAPRRNAIWQADFAEVRVGLTKLYVLIILDDFSRYIVGHALADAPSSDVATETIQKAIARHGKPEAVRSDRGGAFIAYSRETTFGRFLEVELIDHIVGRSYNPKGGGKVEAAVGTLRRELWEIEAFADRDEAAEKLSAFFDNYNSSRAHMGIGGLTPADRFFGRADKVLAAIDALSRKRQGSLSLLQPFGAPLEEIGSLSLGSPLEVLRLVLRDGVMELHFCGARVKLGPIQM